MHCFSAEGLHFSALVNVVIGTSLLFVGCKTVAYSKLLVLEGVLLTESPFTFNSVLIANRLDDLYPNRFDERTYQKIHHKEVLCSWYSIRNVFTFTCISGVTVALPHITSQCST